MIKAIETKYKGYRFRSRLEARWAVFFDELQIPWKYEHEGYDLDGLYYLPDFCVKTKDGRMQFVEVKPDKGMTEIETEKAKRLALKYNGSDVFVVMGDPMEHSIKLFFDDSEFTSVDGMMLKWDREDQKFDWFDRSLSGAELAISYLEQAIEEYLNYRYQEAEWLARQAKYQVMHLSLGLEGKNLHPHLFAAKVARSARFEHGEVIE